MFSSYFMYMLPPLRHIPSFAHPQITNYNFYLFKTQAGALSHTSHSQYSAF